MKKGIFVTGTDTHVGKTFVSSLLVSSLRANGIPVGYFKPLQTGADSDIPGDLETVASLSALSCDEQAPPVYCFPEPMAPSRAAFSNGVEIQLGRVLQHWQALPPRTWVVEGAGGLLVPINSKQTIRELILALELNVVLVSSTRLGTINHTLLSLEAAKTAGIIVSGIVLVGEEDPGRPGLKETLQDFTSTPILAQIPWLSEITSATVKDRASHFFPTSTLNQIFSRPTE